MSTTMTVTEARAALPEVLNRVAGGDEITITRHGRPVAIVVRPDVLRVRRAERAFRFASALEDELLRLAREPLAAEGTIDPARGEELVAGIRAQRDER